MEDFMSAEPGEYHADRCDPGVLGQAISNKLFSVGMDLHFALMQTRDRQSRERLEHAVAEIDDAVKDLRHLMTALMNPR
jgi:hypothetical protein